MSPIVCDHLVPEDQRCIECETEAAKWHPDTRRILELEKENDELGTLANRYHLELTRYRNALAEMSEELSHYPEGTGIFGHLKRILRRALTKTTEPAISIQPEI